MKYIIIFSALLFFSLSIIAAENKGKISGKVVNAKNNEPIPFTNIVIWGTNIGSTSDLDGNFSFAGLAPGYIELRVSAVGYEPFIVTDLLVTNAKVVNITATLKEANVQLETVVVKASAFRRSEESPVSLRRLGIQEIEKNPGGNRDISKVIQSLPGVASSVSFRNDVIVRGGGSSENRFFLDGVEIPNLNHFATQGSSGGPVGIINVDFVREVKFYSGAFPANRGNAMSSVLEFNQVDGNKDKLKTRATIGASDLALTLDGPLSDKTTFIMSARRSYLQFLFSAIGLPFLPTYNDFQYKVKYKIDDKNELSFIGLGAIDQNELNTSANETPDQRYILNYLPVNEQWNYTTGAVYKHFRKKGFDTWVLSRNHLNNVAYKHVNNEESLPRTFDYSSQEIETKLRYEQNIDARSFSFNYGVGVEYAEYLNKTKNTLFINNQLINFAYETNIDMFNYSAFGQVSRKLANDRLTLSLGTRFDASTYSQAMSNPLDQFSPRFSASYNFTGNWFINTNVGRYYQRPAYTSLGFKDNTGTFVNKQNGIRHIQSDHIVAGLEFLPNELTQLSVEGFYKKYSYYPFSAVDSISISGKGADFGTFGDEELLSIAEGRAYGVEFLVRTKSFLGISGIMSYTLVWSDFLDIGQSVYIPTAWDNRNIFNFTLSRSFKRNWDIGMKWRYLGGSPYTPFDENKSSLVSAWDARGQAYLDYNRFNSLRFNSFQQLDLRIDKSYYFNKWSLMLYLDIQNVYNFKAESPDVYTRKSIIDGQSVAGDPYIDANGDSRYIMEYLKSDGSGTVLPTIGIMIEF